MLLKAAAAFGIAAALMGTGPFAGPLSPGWLRVKADLAAARPQARLAAQAHVLFQSGEPHPEPADRQGD
jgi:hypothetical protein